jgi:hypothetical protein
VPSRIHNALLIAAGLALPLASASAARPMIVDDARIVDAKSCQLEAWVRTNPDSRENWAIPACNFTGNLEVAVGGARLRDDDGTRDSVRIVQGKTIFRKLETNDWGLGLSVGAVRHPHEDGAGRATDPYVNLLNSHSFRDDRLVVHANLGLLREQEFRRNRVTGGVGAEFAMTQRAYLVAETFKQTAGRPEYQLGVRYWIIPNRVQVDTTYGHRFGHPEGGRWFSVGLRLLSPAFLP